MFDNYPYGRDSNSSIISYKEISNKRDLLHVYDEDDDEVCVKETDEYKFIIRYDAPRENDKGRGHLSIWVNSESDEYYRCYLYTGDDGTIYDKYMKLFNDKSSIYSFVNKEKIKETL